MRESRWQQFDFAIVACVFGLVVAGVAMIHSATCGSACTGLLPPSSYAVRQGLSAGAGFALLVVISVIDYRLYRPYAFHLYGFAVGLLILVLVIGRGGADNDYGSKRWIYLGVFDLQVSEVAKLAVLIMLARVLGDKPAGPLSFKRLASSLALVAVPVALVFVEPDLGTSLAFLTIWAAMVLVAGVRWRHALLLFASALAVSPLLWLGMKDYMRQRLTTFVGTIFDLEHAAFDDGYNILQARISIGSGGLFGRGYLEGIQGHYGFLRITQSDFIFSAAAEELGFIGAGVLFCLFVMLLFRVTRAADMSRDEFGRLLAFGVGAMILFAAVANLGANLTLLPVTGIPLPFISYGRTSLLTNLAALGIVQSVLLYRLKYRY
ncbi:MAG: rod shape-determining protein RodA [Chloroflexi bacterium]|nr:rod shape-determining protein RodA [Chloroflexota bacterium]MBV9544771.1 rod shape-determining protein RodA [Chloroflexota bacterium]